MNEEAEQTINEAAPADVDAISGDIFAGLDRNESAATNAAKQPPADAERQTAKGGGGYELTEAEKAEPLRNFKTDTSGNIRFHSSGPKKGKPMRSPGKPAPARPGDRLADGSTAKGDQSRESKPKASTNDQSNVFNPLDPAATSTPGDQSNANAVNQSNEPDDAAGEVLIDSFLTCMESIDTRNKATDAERESMRKAARKTFGGLTVPAWVVLLLVAGLYWTRTRLIKTKDKPNAGNDASVVRGNDADREKQPVEENHGSGLTW